MMRRPRASLRLGHIRSVRDSDRGLDRLPQHGIVVSLVMMVLIVGVALLLVRTRAALEHVKVDSAAMVRFAPTNPWLVIRS